MLLNQLNHDQRALILEIHNLLKNQGAKVFLVGGCVRDMIIGDVPKDIDLEVFNLDPKAIESCLKKKFKIESVGRQFGVFILKNHAVDISIPRRESKIGDKHADFKVEGDPFMHPKTAALRRDFTINAIAYDLDKNQLFDPFNGREDLSNKILRHVSDAFDEDALRVLRAMQFTARFDLKVAPETLAKCQTLSPESLPKERIWDEWKKLIIKGKKISEGLQFLSDCHWLQYFPELAALENCQQDPKWHPEGTVWNHTKHCMDAFAQRRISNEWEDLIVGIATLCHDMGKPTTSKISEDGRIRSPKHDVEGVAVARSFLSRMTEHKKVFDAVLPLVAQHMQPYNLYKNQSGDSAIRRLAAKVKRIDRLMRLVEADQMGRPPIKVTKFEISQWILLKSEKLNIKDSEPKPIIQGRHLIQLNIAPSPKFKKILNQCYEAQIEGSFDNEATGLEYLKSIIQ